VVAVAKADSALTPEEGAIIVEALEDAKLPDGITARALIDSSSDVDSLIGQVESQGARDVAFAACITIAAADDGCLPKQQAILDRIEAAWAVTTETR
jgi:tellurite resistance protein